MWTSVAGKIWMPRTFPDPKVTIIPYLKYVSPFLPVSYLGQKSISFPFANTGKKMEGTFQMRMGLLHLPASFAFGLRALLPSPACARQQGLRCPTTSIEMLLNIKRYSKTPEQCDRDVRMQRDCGYKAALKL